MKEARLGKSILCRKAMADNEVSGALMRRCAGHHCPQTSEIVRVAVGLAIEAAGLAIPIRRSCRHPFALSLQPLRSFAVVWLSVSLAATAALCSHNSAPSQLSCAQGSHFPFA